MFNSSRKNIKLENKHYEFSKIIALKFWYKYNYGGILMSVIRVFKIFCYVFIIALLSSFSVLKKTNIDEKTFKIDNYLFTTYFNFYYHKSENYEMIRDSTKYYIKYTDLNRDKYYSYFEKLSTKLNFPSNQISGEKYNNMILLTVELDGNHKRIEIIDLKNRKHFSNTFDKPFISAYLDLWQNLVLIFHNRYEIYNKTNFKMIKKKYWDLKAENLNNYTTVELNPDRTSVDIIQNFILIDNQLILKFSEMDNNYLLNYDLNADTFVWKNEYPKANKVDEKILDSFLLLSYNKEAKDNSGLNARYCRYYNLHDGNYKEMRIVDLKANEIIIHDSIATICVFGENSNNHYDEMVKVVNVFTEDNSTVPSKVSYIREHIKYDKYIILKDSWNSIIIYNFVEKKIDSKIKVGDDFEYIVLDEYLIIDNENIVIYNLNSHEIINNVEIVSKKINEKEFNIIRTEEKDFLYIDDKLLNLKINK